MSFSRNLTLIAALLCALLFGPPIQAQVDGFVAGINRGNPSSGTPCTIYCNDPFGSVTTAVVLVPGVGNFSVEYSKRSLGCQTGYFDLQVHTIYSHGAAGVDLYAGYSISCLIDAVMSQLIYSNPFGTPGSQSLQHCNVSFRVLKASCWSRINVGADDCPVIYAPCTDVSCCIDLYCATNFASQGISNLVLGGRIGEICDDDVVFGTPPAGGSACEEACFNCHELTN